MKHIDVYSNETKDGNFRLKNILENARAGITQMQAKQFDFLAEADAQNPKENVGDWSSNRKVCKKPFMIYWQHYGRKNYNY